DPYRVDENVSANATHYAVFTESRLPDDLPPEPKEADDDPDKPPASPGSGSGNGGTMGSSEWEQPNFVFDGETNYAGKVYDMAYEEAMEWIAENPNISDAERDLIVGYFKTIEKKE
ncbi:MAG: hypothetical protein IJU84_06470, partial [Clostridia bacterium]|nr:hypothetical protein [Clostridia bacterium]